MAAWGYLAPLAAIGILALAVLVLGVFLVLLRTAIILLQRFGA